MTDVLVCEELGMSARQLRRWREAVQQHGEEDAFPGKGRARDQEMMLLKRKLKEAEQELDFLREAARYFARESM